MILCHCRAVTDGVVRRAIARGACDLDEVAARCGAGARCGGCRPALLSLLGSPDELATAGA